VKLTPLILSTVILFGFSDIGYSQNRDAIERFKKITKKIQTRAKQKTARKVTIVSLKQISKKDFISGRHKKLIIPYEEGGKIKTISADWKSGKYVKVIPMGRGKSKTISLKADSPTYDKWRKKKGW